MELDKHYSIDLETLGTKITAPFISIGAVRFNIATGDILDSFHGNIIWLSALRYGAAEDSTIRWWAEQTEDAKAALFENQRELEVVMKDFHNWLEEGCIVWGNGALFDVGMLENYYQGTQKWSFRNVRDVRTMNQLGKELLNYPIKMMPFDGEPHNALDDARHQAEYVSLVYKSLRDSISMTGSGVL